MTKIADVGFDCVYFVDGGKIVFQKSTEELGIDVSNPKNAFDKSHLEFILKK